MKEGRALQMTAGPCRWRPGPTGDDRALQVTAGPCRWRQGPAGDGRALQVTARPCRWRPGPAGDGRALQVTAGPCRSCAGRQGPAVTLLDGRLFHMTDGPALRCETPARDARDCRPVGTYRAPGTLGITANNRPLSPDGQIYSRSYTNVVAFFWIHSIIQEISY